jgi:long-chain acyl-CoA synthetase
VLADRVNKNGRVSSPDGTGDIGIPANLGTNVADLLREAARRYPQRPAVIGPNDSRTWGQLDAAADAGVAALVGLGLGPGERVVIALPTGADLALALFAVARAGLIAVPIGPPRGDAGAFADRVGAIAAISDEDDHGLPISLNTASLREWWLVDPVADPPAAIGGGEDLTLLARARGDRAVMLSHRAVLAAVTAIGELGSLRLRDHDRALQVLPMYHLAGWVVAFLPTTLIGGATIIPAVGFDAALVGIGVHGSSAQGGGAAGAGRAATESALAAAHEHRATLVPGAPGFYHHLVTVQGAERALASVRLLTSGTAPLEPDDFALVHTLMGQPVWEGYGLSESASVVTSSLRTPRPHHGSVGRPVAGLELRVIGPDGHDVTPTVGPVSARDAEPLTHDRFDFVAETPDAGEVGRIVIRGATLFSGYWPDGGGGPGADGWFVTGDIGYLDDAGELHLVDRAAEVIKVAGFTVYPREVEEVLTTHPYVAEVAVIGMPGADGQEQVVAVLVPRAGTHPTPDDLTEFLRGQLAPFKRPVVYHLVSALPRTEVGRLDRGSVQRGYALAAGLPLSRLTSVGPRGADGSAADEPAGDGEAADTAPEAVANLDELGTKLPGTGNRADRGDLDTDEDLF